MKTKIINIDGKAGKEIDLPDCFDAEIREDIISKVLETLKTKQPYAPSPVAGKQHSASGKLVHRRHVWKSQYGRGISRVPRKILIRRGSQFHWEAAEVPQARGGRRAHPPKVVSMINTKKINKKEGKIALISSLAATADEKFVRKKYSSLKDKKIENLPFVVEENIVSLKVKQLKDFLKKILNEIYDVAEKKKSVRAGRGKMRGRKYKSNAGLLIVIGKDEKIKGKMFDVVNVDKLNVDDLAKGGAGRLTIYTENAIRYLGEKLK